ncbi:MAG: two-component system response regulator [Candidatus Odinarchaeota archaeon]
MGNDTDEENGIKPEILLVEDDEDLLYNTEMILVFNGYKVITAKNGKEGLEKLASLQQSPDLVISDIMMPEMNGYDLFKELSRHPQWNLVPFIFVTAKSSPEEVRFGKTLGADDYLTKPFVEKDLLATVAGKIARGRKHRTVSNQIKENLLASLQLDFQLQASVDVKESVIVFLMVWDEVMGPELLDSFPPVKALPFDLDRLGVQLFHASATVYGPERYYDSQGVLLHVANINMDGYLFFDTSSDEGIRGGRRQFMLSALAPKINYLESLRIKEFFEAVSVMMKKRDSLAVPHGENECQEYWRKITNILTSPVLDVNYAAGNGSFLKKEV